MIDLIKKVARYTEEQRTQRLIEITALGENATSNDSLEFIMIQTIRDINGEIDITQI